ncbi:MAG: SDR family oxidoreductase [Sphaerochaetaceae bacterium]|jgi:NAD(P)-dependent dehydrogenase (short-subunit alcohol dehydrogenase family)|nr:SDR family oxidoreductase [Sphaerochaetaceae bacterium]
MKEDKFVLVTGGARRIGRSIALAIARSGIDVALHYWQSQTEADILREEIEALGRKIILLQADLAQIEQVKTLVPRVLEHGFLVGLINNASIFEKLNWENSSLEDWNRHLMVNLTAPFLLSQAFARALPPEEKGRIINLLDWRVSRPSAEHLPYSISKSALASLTHSLAAALAPHITVNGLALGAVLPPTDGAVDKKILDKIPSGRWATLEEINQALLFLLTGPTYITGEILYVDGGRHLL